MQAPCQVTRPISRNNFNDLRQLSNICHTLTHFPRGQLFYPEAKTSIQWNSPTLRPKYRSFNALKIQNQSARHRRQSIRHNSVEIILPTDHPTRWADRDDRHRPFDYATDSEPVGCSWTGFSGWISSKWI